MGTEVKGILFCFGFAAYLCADEDYSVEWGTLMTQEKGVNWRSQALDYAGGWNTVHRGGVGVRNRYEPTCSNRGNGAT